MLINSTCRYPLEPLEIGADNPIVDKTIAWFLDEAQDLLQRSGFREDPLPLLDQAIAYLRTVVNLDLDHYRLFPMALYHLGFAHLRRYKWFGDQQDLEEAVSKLSEAVNWTPSYHSLRRTVLEACADACYLHFEWSQEENYLRDCIPLLEEAIGMWDSTASPLRFLLRNLGKVFLDLFEKAQEKTDWDMAAELFTEARELCPLKDTMTLMNLSFDLADTFHTLHDRTVLGVTHLETAISHRRSGISFLFDNESNGLGVQLAKLGDELYERYRYSALQERLDESISLLQYSATLHQDKFQRASLLSKLGNFLGLRLRLRGLPADGREAIEVLRYSLSAHNELGLKWTSWQYSKVALISFELHSTSRSSGDIDGTIQWFRKAVDISRKDSDLLSPQIFGLGLALYARFKVHGDASALDETIVHLRTLVGPNKGYAGKYVHRLAVALHARFELSASYADLEECLGVLLKVCSLPINSLLFRRSHFTCAVLLASLAKRYGRLDISLQGYQRAVDMLPHVSLKNADVASRQQDLSSHAVDLACDAASCAIELGKFETAVDLLERGRSAFWSHNLVLHPDLTALEASHPLLAEEFEQASEAVVHAQAIVTADPDPIKSSTILRPTPGEFLEHYRRIEDDSYHAQVHRISPNDLVLIRAVDEMERCLTAIREVQGFQSFLRPLEVSELMDGTVGRNVVMINISRLRCDALILQREASSPVRLVTLPEASYDKILALSQQLQSALGMANVRVRQSEATRHVRPARIRSTAERLRIILSSLWSWIVHPVLKALSLNISSYPPRIFWYPTGPLTYLPLHAAGRYNGTDLPDKGQAVYDYVVSSYIPSLRSLVRSRPTEVRTPRLLVVSQPNTPGQKPLPMTTQEVTTIVNVAKSLVPITRLDGNDATVERVASSLAECDWCHFACHGAQDTTQPLQSGLLVQDGLVSIDRILSLKIPSSQFAFLSACQTATSDIYLPDESLHITASLLFAGFGGIIGSLWSISDSDAPIVAEGVYTRMLANPAPSSEDVAGALHESVARLRESGVSLERWAPFVHFGL